MGSEAKSCGSSGGSAGSDAAAVGCEGEIPINGDTEQVKAAGVRHTLAIDVDADGPSRRIYHQDLSLGLVERQPVGGGVSGQAGSEPLEGVGGRRDVVTGGPHGDIVGVGDHAALVIAVVDAESRGEVRHEDDEEEGAQNRALPHSVLGRWQQQT